MTYISPIERALPAMPNSHGTLGPMWFADQVDRAKANDRRIEHEKTLKPASLADLRNGGNMPSYNPKRMPRFDSILWDVAIFGIAVVGFASIAIQVWRLS